MKWVIINAYQIGLVFKKGAYQRMLKEGTYWLWPAEKGEVYDVTKPFTPAYELNILLQDTQLAEALHVIQVKDHEIALLYENGLFKQVLTPGRYVGAADVEDDEVPEGMEDAVRLAAASCPEGAILLIGE